MRQLATARDRLATKFSKALFTVPNAPEITLDLSLLQTRREAQKAAAGSLLGGDRSNTVDGLPDDFSVLALTRASLAQDPRAVWVRGIAMSLPDSPALRLVLFALMGAARNGGPTRAQLGLPELSTWVQRLYHLSCHATGHIGVGAHQQKKAVSREQAKFLQYATERANRYVDAL